MKRVFIHSTKECEKKCRYCFSDWNNYIAPQVDCRDIEDESVIAFYPTCDSDFEIDWRVCDRILKKYNERKTVIFSFSCKGNISEESLNELIDLNSRINNGYVKLSVGFTTKNRVEDIEPGTSSYKDRILLLKRLKELNIKTSVVLKPILPFIDLDEYYEIINDTSFVETFLIGGLYVNEKDKFYDEFIRYKYESVDRVVKWCNNTIWKYVEDSRIETIKGYIKQKGCYVFDSDECVLEFLLRDDELKG